MPPRHVLSLLIIAIVLLATCATPTHAGATITLTYRNVVPFVLPLQVRAVDADVIRVEGDEWNGVIEIRPLTTCWTVTATDRAGQGAAWWSTPPKTCTARPLFALYAPLVAR